MARISGLRAHPRNHRAAAALRFLSLAALLAWTRPGTAQLSPRPETPVQTEKSRYSLFHPTPESQLRDLSTDRPDQTESPYTVDAGRLQIEMDFISVVLDHDDQPGGDLETEVWNLVPFNLKIGLLNQVDLQFTIDPQIHVRERDRATGDLVEASGFGDLVNRLKVNLWGNDGGPTALALMPWIKWPLPSSSLRNAEVEGGLIIALALDLGHGWGLGAMTEFDWLRDDLDECDPYFVNSVTVARELNDRLGVYAEFFTIASPADEFEWRGQVDVGLTYALRPGLQLDAGCNFGVTRSAPDYNPFLGASMRF